MADKDKGNKKKPSGAFYRKRKAEQFIENKKQSALLKRFFSVDGVDDNPSSSFTRTSNNDSDCGNASTSSVVDNSEKKSTDITTEITEIQNVRNADTVGEQSPILANDDGPGPDKDNGKRCSMGEFYEITEKNTETVEEQSPILENDDGPSPDKNSEKRCSLEEFNDENRNTLKHTEKKRWIHDPTSELCGPLSCKKKELCLLEDPWTAVCVSKKELHRSGDTVVPKDKLSPEEAAKYSSAPRDQDPFYDSDDEDDEEDSSQDVVQARCNPCPVVKPTFLCGTDNRTYSSLCRLDYHNCIHRTSIKVLCKGFCPCKDGDNHARKKQKTDSDMRLSNLMNKYKSTVMEEPKKDNVISNNVIDKYTFTPQDFSYENKHYKYIKYTKHENKPTKSVTNPPYYEDKERLRGDNEVIERKPAARAKAECPAQALQAMGDRLLDWFSVIMADSNKRQTHTRTKGVTRFPTGCKNEVRWMFHHLDTDSDVRLSLQELYDLEHDQNERCIKPFLDACDVDRDIFVTPHEWCKCFEKTDRPCAAVKRRISTNMLGVYVPECDSEGYYYHTQCHVSVGMCWCVDKHGVELPNSRTRGKPNCESLLGKTKGKPSDIVSDDDDDDDDDDSDQDIEGSADQPLDF